MLFQHCPKKETIMFKFYKIEVQTENGWHTLLMCSGMPKGKTDGAMMILDSIYDGVKYRAVCEQTQEIYKTAGGRQPPKPA